MPRKVSIIVAEDDHIDRKAIARALKPLEDRIELFMARDGLEGLELLRGDDGRDPPPAPRIVLLDLNMPRMSGMEFLEHLRKDEQLASTPVIMVSSSDHRHDIQKAYGRHVSAFVRKGLTSNELQRVIKLVEDYVGIVELPD